MNHYIKITEMDIIENYEKNGFVKLGIRKNFYQFPQEDADIMEWKKC